MKSVVILVIVTFLVACGAACDDGGRIDAVRAPPNTQGGRCQGVDPGEYVSKARYPDAILDHNECFDEVVCPLFPQTDAWNIDISKHPVHSRSAAFINSIGADETLHPDFGSGSHLGSPIGIPYILINNDTANVPVKFTMYPEESEPGPYPIPIDAPIEGAHAGEIPHEDGDRHVIALNLNQCRLYELYKAKRTPQGWSAESGAIFDLTSRNLPPRLDGKAKIGWTSADAAGLAIFPGLILYDEVKRGHINHAVRFTVAKSQRAYIFPATHYAHPYTDPDLPPMGLRLRLKADFNISKFSAHNQVILRALKTYGMIVADNGVDWMISGEPHESWDNRELSELKTIRGRDFEVVDTGPVNTR